jgi:hypothetical protein
MFPDDEFRGTLVLGIELLGRRHFSQLLGEGWLMKKYASAFPADCQEKNDGSAIIIY